MNIWEYHGQCPFCDYCCHEIVEYLFDADGNTIGYMIRCKSCAYTYDTI